MKFARKGRFSPRLKFDLKAFNQILNYLRGAGYSVIKIKIPENYENFDNKILSPEEFAEKGYNFSAVILSAAKENSTESVRILFVNNSNVKSVFKDEVFPSAHSVSPSYSVITDDPVRLIGLCDFVEKLIKKNSSLDAFGAKLQEALLLMTSFLLSLAVTVLTLQYARGPGTDLASILFTPVYLLPLLLVSVLYIFYYTLHPGGLYVAPFEHPFLSFARRIFVGDLRNNLLVMFALFIFKVIFVGVIVGLITEVVWGLFGESILAQIRLLF